MIFDVAIVGAGPTGACAAAQLLEHFDSVLLLDKAEFPRDKLCAGVLPPRIHSLVDIPQDVCQRPLSGYRIFAPSGRSVESSFPRKGVMVERRAFDEFLLGKVKTDLVYDRITRIEPADDLIGLVGEEGTYQARMVIGADGVNSVVRKALEIHMDKIAMAVQVDISLPQVAISERVGDWFEVYYILPRGYGWLSPMKDGVKVGMGGISEDFKKNPTEHLNRFLEHIKDKIDGGERCEVKHWRIPMGGPLEVLAGHRCLLAGDAGGFVYPGTGEGVYYGMKSGILAAQTVKEAFDQGNFDQGFLQETYSKKLEAGGLLSLRDVAFIEEVLATEETAEKYVKRLSLLGKN
jgi:geranylgeranyl reductase family protein